jgi:phospholipase C
VQLQADQLSHPITRRQAIAGAGTLSAAALAAGAALSPPGWARLVQRAARARAAGSDLGAVEHIVFLMMENRSYDNYFGAYPRGRGFDDHPKRSLGAFAQAYPGGTSLNPKQVLLPFHLDQQCQNDPTHDWGPTHLCWDHGKMDAFVRTHTMPKYEGASGTTVMGYYERSDLPFYYALADNFTLCDGYHCSVLGPTHPNRLLAVSGTLDPDGKAGGPITDTNVNPALLGSCHWTTMPEVLEDRGISWKTYTPSNVGSNPKYSFLAGPDYKSWNPELSNPTSNPEVLLTSDSILPYFAAYRSPSSALYQKAFLETFPYDFASDVNAGTLPSVSWVIPPVGWDEHPSSSPARGMFFTSMVLDALTANPDVWAKTVLFVMHDEHGGFFDHVPPPTPPPGTPGEYLTAPPKGGNPTPDTLGISGPVGLGVRVPLLVISPFSRGGQIVSDTFDHTSQLKLIAARFGVEVPNLSAWRKQAVGDLTTTLFRAPADTSVPKLPAINIPSTGACDKTDQDDELGGAPSPVPTQQRMPKQGGGSTPASYYFGAKPGERKHRKHKHNKHKHLKHKPSTHKHRKHQHRKHQRDPDWTHS